MKDEWLANTEKYAGTHCFAQYTRYNNNAIKIVKQYVTPSTLARWARRYRYPSLGQNDIIGERDGMRRLEVSERAEASRRCCWRRH